MRPEEFTALIVPSLVAPIVVTGLASVAAAGVGVLLVQGRRVPPAIAAASALPALVIGGASAWAMSGATDDLSTRDAVALAVGQHLVLPLLYGLPASLALLLGAAAGAMHAPRRAGVAVAGGVLVAVVIGLCLYLGQVIAEPVFTTFRAATYGLTGAFAVAALLGGGPEDRAGPEAAAWSGVTWALCVAVGEAGGRSLAELQALLGLAGQPAANRLEVARVYASTVIDPHAPIAWAMFGVAALVAIFGVSAAASKGGTRAAGSAAALLWLGAGALVLGTGHPTPEQLVTAASVGAPAAEPAGPAVATP